MADQPKPENPPLFERYFDEDGDLRIETGVTLRDLFAAAALNALVAHGELTRASNAAKRHGGSPESSTAYTAYQLADAMLAAREGADRG